MVNMVIMGKDSKTSYLAKRGRYGGSHLNCRFYDSKLVETHIG